MTIRRSARSLVALLSIPFAVPAVAQATDPGAAPPPAVDTLAAALDGGEDVFAGAQVLTRTALVAAVLARNPSLEAARHAWRAAASRAAGAGSWRDPMVSVGVAPLSIGSEMDFGGLVEARQPLPRAGALRRATDLARAEAAVAAEDHRALLLELAWAASDLWFELARLESAVGITADHQALVEDLLTLATARYAAGLTPQQAPLQAEVELTHLMHRAMVLAAERDVLVARLNALLHRRPTAALPPAAPLRAAAESAAGASPREHTAALRHLPDRPELAAADAAVRAAELARELAGLERVPGVELMASYNSMFGGDHRLMLGVAVELPVHRERLAAAEAEAEALLAAAESRRDALAVALLAEVEQTAVRVHEADHVVELYAARVLPASRDAARAARVGYETGGVDFTAVIDAERNLREVDLAYEEALAELGRRRAALARAVGGVAGLDGAVPPSAVLPSPDPLSAAPGGSRR